MPDRGLRRRVVVFAVCLTAVLATAIAVDVGRARPRRAGAISSASVSVAPRPAHPTASSAPITYPTAAVGRLLAGRATAIRTGDRAAWLAPLDPSAGARAAQFRAGQGQVFDRIRTLHPVSWSYLVDGGSPVPPARRAALGGSAWLADVQLDYQLTSGGARVRRQQYLTIVRRPVGWRIAADTDGATSRDIWDLGPITVASAQRCLVVGAVARSAQVSQLAAECDQAAQTVDAAWGTSWPRRSVLTIPATVAQLAILLGRTGAGASDGASDTAGLERTAAVTIGPGAAAADQVLINGTAFDQLLALGRRVVLTHELVHVATRATGSRSAPTWLEEGFADEVAYAGTGLAPEQVAGDALDAVRAGRVPRQLPDSEDFNAAGDHAAAAYGQAWVAVRLIAAKAGSPARLKTFYQQAAAGPNTGSAARTAIVDAALTQIGVRGTAAFIPLWQAQLRALAK